jgi:hypothetical protein
VTSDAELIETAFAAKLTELGSIDSSRSEASLESNKNGDPIPSTSSSKKSIESPSRKLNGHRIPQRSTGKEDAIAVTPIGKTLRLRDPDHLKSVRAQPCLACGRSPSDAHHVKYAQARALGRKVSDEFAVPLCRTHHRELHRRGDERIWWQQMNLDPLPTASALWMQTHPGLAAPAKSTSAASANGVRIYETKPIIQADIP